MSGCWTEGLFITLGGPKAHDSSLEKPLHKSGCPIQDLFWAWWARALTSNLNFSPKPNGSARLDGAPVQSCRFPWF